MARLLAFIAILLGGFAGALISYALVDIQTTGASDLALGLGLFVGAVITAGGTAIVAILVLRAVGEWRDINDRSARR
ncbi:MAG: hypothetical protein RLZZ128_20 [Actinomycetota bacterium]